MGVTGYMVILGREILNREAVDDGLSSNARIKIKHAVVGGFRPGTVDDGPKCTAGQLEHRPFYRNQFIAPIGRIGNYLDAVLHHQQLIVGARFDQDDVSGFCGIDGRLNALVIVRHCDGFPINMEFRVNQRQRRLLSSC